MSDNIKFDFAKAQSLLNSINECKRSINSLATRLGTEVNKAGSWWIGESYDGYKDSFFGVNGGKSTVDGIAAQTATIGNYLITVAQMKRGWEQRGKSNF